MKISLCITTVAAALAGLAQQQANNGHVDRLVILEVPAKGQAKLGVTTPAFKNGADMPFENTQYRGNIFPGLSWTKGPAGTKSYVVVVQGELNGPGSNTSIHLVLFNIPADVTRLDAGMTGPPAGAMYGPNVHGLNTAYAGPHTHNFTKHEYHFQVLAIDTVLPNDPKASLPGIESAMTGHVLASGDVVGLAAMDPESPEATQVKKKGG